MAGIPDHYQISVQKVSASDMKKELVFNNHGEEEKTKNEQKQHKVFISHSSIDKEIVLEFVELLEAIGLQESSIVCTSVPAYGVPGGLKIYDWLRKQFTECKLRVIFVLSNNYYASPASLNEMGAAWVTQASHTLILLPGFDFNDIQGCVDSTEIGIALGGDEDELKHRLNELKDTLIEEYSLPSIQSAKWDRKRNEFISKIHTMDSEKKGKQRDEIKSNDQSYNDSAILKGIPLESLILLVYAAEKDGQILKLLSPDGLIFMAGDKNVMKDSTPRENAKWQNAVDKLLEMGLVECRGSTNSAYGVTLAGFEMSDLVQGQMNIETTKDLQAILSGFE